MWDSYYPDYNSHVFSISQLTEFLEDAVGGAKNVQLVHQGKTEYFNIPAAFDIEASSWATGTYEQDNVQHWATMYIWQFGLNGSVIYGRTWQEFGMLLELLEKELGLCKKRHLVIYVHNLGYEFQWIRKYFQWDKVFAIKNRRPVYAISGGIEFRCSYFLSNYALAYIGDELLTKYPVSKLIGSLDYSKVRHSSTPLTPRELAYCINDVRVLMSYIQEKIENDGDITQIPLTNTGYVRNYCRESCFYEGISQINESERQKVRLNYRAIMKSLQITSEDEYNQMKRAFMGGFTHASVLHAGGDIIYDVGSADLTSSYPYTMVAQYFPMTRFKLLGTINDPEFLKTLLKKYCCIFDCAFTNLRPKVEFENIISASRCWNPDGGSLPRDLRLNNGRVISCSRIATTLTELDFENITRFYCWDDISIVNFRIAHRGYLPKALILSVLNLYESKTSLKGIAGKEVEYLVSKNMINAAFGMMVTAIIRGEYVYNDSYGWETFAADVEKQLDSYNKNFNRFLYYGWGVYVTAHARHNLFSAIWEFGADYVYADTDSIKGINFDDHKDYFISYNKAVYDSLIKVCGLLNIPLSKIAPKTRDGVKKTLGVWEIEEGYSKFKAAGAKRYIYTYANGLFQMTCAGVRKSEAVPWLLYQYAGGSLSSIESMCSDFCVSQLIPIKYDSAFLTIARLAYGRYPETKSCKSFLLTLPLNPDPIFAIFGEGLCIPSAHTGKQTVDYLDYGFRTACTDYLNNTTIITEQSAVYMEPQAYKMSITGEYRDLIQGVQQVAE